MRRLTPKTKANLSIVCFRHVIKSEYIGADSVTKNCMEENALDTTGPRK